MSEDEQKTANAPAWLLLRLRPDRTSLAQSYLCEASPIYPTLGGLPVPAKSLKIGAFAIWTLKIRYGKLLPGVG